MNWLYGDVLIFSISIAVIQSVSMPIISFGKCNSMKKYEDCNDRIIMCSYLLFIY